MSLLNLTPGILSQGNLAEHPAVELLGVLFAQRKTGELRVASGETETRINAFNGIPINAVTTAEGLSIIDIMLEDKALMLEDLLQIRQFAREHGLGLVEALKRLLEIRESEIYYYRAKSAKEIIIKTCGFGEGEYAFTEGEDELIGLEMYDLNPLELIYEGIARYPIADLGGQLYRLEGRRLKLGETKENFLLPGPLYQHSDLLDAFLEGVSVGRALTLFEEEMRNVELAVHFLYLLILTGMVAIQDEIPAEAIFDDVPGLDQARRRLRGVDDGDVVDLPESRSDDFEAADGLDEGPSPETIDAAPRLIREAFGPRVMRQRDKAIRVEAGPKTPEEWKRRLTELDSHQAMTSSIYDLLGVSMAEGITELQEAYSAKIAELPNPKTLHQLSPELQELAAKVRDVYEYAYQILAEPQRRVRFERERFEEEVEDAYDAERRSALARKLNERGEWYLRHNVPAFAREFFENAHDLDPGAPAYYLNLGRAIFRAQPDNALEAIGYLHSALQLDPNLDSVHYQLGVIHKREGRNDEAEKDFRRALDLNPENASARRELDFLHQREKQKSFWQNIFEKA